jgi:threonyl-tRNA synthetase
VYLTFQLRGIRRLYDKWVLVVGDREVENNQVSVRRRGGEDLGSMSIEALIDLIKQE